MIIAMENGPIWPILRLIIYLRNLPVQNCYHLPAGRNIHQNCNYMSYRRIQQAYGLGSPFHWLWAMAVFFASVSCWTVCIHSTAAKQMDGYLIPDFGYVYSSLIRLINLKRIFSGSGCALHKWIAKKTIRTKHLLEPQEEKGNLVSFRWVQFAEIW